MSAIPMNNSRNNPNDGYSSSFSPTNSADDSNSFDFTCRSNRSDGNGSMNRRANTSGYSRYNGNGGGGGGGNVSIHNSRSGSELYSENDSDIDEDYADAAGHVLSATQHCSNVVRNRHDVTREDFLRGMNEQTSSSAGRDSASSPTGRLPSTARRAGNPTGVDPMSPSDTPLSYFHRQNCSAFSIKNEIRCYYSHLRHLFKAVEEDRLPWKTDFADWQKMRFPRKMKEIVGRLNLNIPYYSSNYIEVFYVVTMPFLFFYNTPFFLVAFLTMALIHSVTLRRKNARVYGESVMILGRPISYRNLAHVVLFAFAMLFMFFDGLKTLIWVILLNLSVIVPHAVIRKPTYFDDEELEKCRPKLGQYFIVLLILALDYLEGDVRDGDETMSHRLVEREKKRLTAVLEKREGKD